MKETYEVIIKNEDGDVIFKEDYLLVDIDLDNKKINIKPLKAKC